MTSSALGFVPPDVVAVRPDELKDHIDSLSSVNIPAEKRFRATTLEHVPEGHPHVVVFLVRHGEGVHNVAGHEQGDAAYLLEDYADAALTEKGKAQARAGGEYTKRVHPELNGALVYTSPLQRAIVTAKLAFPEAGKFVAHDLLHEQGGKHPCDRRRPPAALAESFSRLDVSLLEGDEDPTWSVTVREPKQAVAERGQQFFESVW